MTDYGTLTDYITGEDIRPATEEELALSLEAGPTGVFTIDRDGEPCPADADLAVYGPLRSVFVEGGAVSAPTITAQHILDLGASRAAEPAIVQNRETGEVSVYSTLHPDVLYRTIVTREDLYNIEQSGTIDIDNMSTDNAQEFADHLNQLDAAQR